MIVFFFHFVVVVIFSFGFVLHSITKRNLFYSFHTFCFLLYYISYQSVGLSLRWHFYWMKQNLIELLFFSTIFFSLILSLSFAFETPENHLNVVFFIFAWFRLNVRLSQSFSLTLFWPNSSMNFFYLFFSFKKSL